jgi:hypothetical protein
LGFSGQTARITARPWSLRRFKVAIGGGFAVTLPPGTSRPALTVAGETLRGKVAFADTDAPILLDLSADTVSASRTAVAGEAGRELTIATASFTLSRPETPPQADTDTAYTLTAHLVDLSGPSIESNPLGATIADTMVDAKLLGPPPATPDAAGLRAWRDAGGTLDIGNLSLRWGALALGANGTLALDAQMQPEGAFTTHLSGFETALDALAAAGWIKPSAADLAKLALGLGSHPGPDGKPVVDTPLTIQNRRISAGPLKLGQVPELKID